MNRHAQNTDFEIMLYLIFHLTISHQLKDSVAVFSYTADTLKGFAYVVPSAWNVLPLLFIKILLTLQNTARISSPLFEALPFFGIFITTKWESILEQGTEIRSYTK